MTAYYNEFDPSAAAWLRQLITDGLIAPGDVDDRSIADVLPIDLDGYTQCHFFAGVGVWSYALRNAGWPDDRPIWTGSCPCQPFSSAGQRKGSSDERHLWPHMLRLIEKCRPEIVVGEQVGSSDVIGKVKPAHAGENSKDWIDIVQADLEAAHYECGSVVGTSAGVGSPNIRMRAWWMAHASSKGLSGHGRPGEKPISQGRFRAQGHRAETSMVGGMGHPSKERRQQQQMQSVSNGERMAPEGREQVESSETSCNAIRLADSNGNGFYKRRECSATPRDDGLAGDSESIKPDPCNGFWSDPDWLWCQDEKWRPIESGVEPLVDGPAERVVRGSNQGAPINANKTNEARAMRLKGYGNAINAEAAKVFIKCAMEVVL